MVHISDFANENTVPIDTDHMTVGQLTDALARFPRDLPVVVVYTENGRLVGAAADLDGLMGNNYKAEDSNFAGLIMELTSEPFRISDLIAPTEPTEPTEATPNENPLAS